MPASIQTASGQSKCRIITNNIICGKIHKGQKVLCVYAQGAGGGDAAYFCEKHMQKELDTFVIAIKDSKRK